MVGESSKSSVNERLARAREEDLRRCRNLQAKLARAQAHGLEEQPDSEAIPAATPRQLSLPNAAPSSSSSSRAGLMFLSSTEQAQRERDQRSREGQLKRQVAGPIPPESWRDDFDRLGLRRSGASGSHSRRSKDSNSTSDNGHVQHNGGGDRQRTRIQHARTCAGVRHLFDPPETSDALALSLRDMTLCVIADAVNHTLDMDQTQRREVLEYLPRHLQQRLLALCGRRAATTYALTDRTVQALLDIDRLEGLGGEEEDRHGHTEDDDDWEATTDQTSGSVVYSSGSQGDICLDLSFSTITPRSISRMLSSQHGQMGVSLRMLSLAGWSASSSTTPLDSPQMLSILAQLPNLQILSLAGSHLSRSPSDGETDSQRAAVFLRKLSRSLPKLTSLDLSFCRWVSADAILAVSWATPSTVAWPRLENLLLVGCKAFSDPRHDGRTAEEGERGRFSGTPAGNHVAAWHATHSQRAIAESADVPGGLYDAVIDTHHRDPFDLFSHPTPRSSTRATFADYVTGTIQPAIISQSLSTPGDGVLKEYVRCPRGTGQIEMWQWQRARVLEAVRGRARSGSKQRGWIELFF